MKQSIGYTLSLNIAITFIIIVFAFISMALSYYRAFKVSKIITSVIEKNEGYTRSAEAEIINKLEAVGYNIVSVSCAKTRTLDTGKECYLDSGIYSGVSYSEGQNGYCIYFCDLGNGYYMYKTTTNMMLNIPIINRISNVPVEINTNKMYGYYGYKKSEIENLTHYYSYESSGSIGGTLPNGAKDNKTQVLLNNKTSYLKIDVKGNEITSAYACFVKSNKEYCLEGGDSGDAYENNKTILNNAFNSSNCEEEDFGGIKWYSCGTQEEREYAVFSANSSGFARANRCEVSVNGNFNCSN